jgi:hypothetical protein
MVIKAPCQHRPPREAAPPLIPDIARGARPPETLTDNAPGRMHIFPYLLLQIGHKVKGYPPEKTPCPIPKKNQVIRKKSLADGFRAAIDFCPLSQYML